jgi:hypothetical protein
MVIHNENSNLNIVVLVAASTEVLKQFTGKSWDQIIQINNKKSLITLDDRIEKVSEYIGHRARVP